MLMQESSSPLQQPIKGLREKNEKKYYEFRHGLTFYTFCGISPPPRRDTNICFWHTRLERESLPC
jgi:hypothetical protein